MSPPPKIPNAERRSREHLTPAEIDRLIAAARQLGRHGHRDATMILLAYRHGLRVSELVSLRREQLDLRPGLLHVRRRKNGLPSTHPLREPELRALREVLRDYPEFYRRNAAMRLAGSGRAGASPPSPHDLHIKAAGHRDPSTTKLYDRRGYNPEKSGQLLCDLLKKRGVRRDRGLAPTSIRPFDVAAWVKELQDKHSTPGVKQQLAAVRMLFDYLITGQVVPMNPAAAVRGPRRCAATDTERITS
jgi:site-specific recombinase XerD